MRNRQCEPYSDLTCASPIALSPSRISAAHPPVVALDPPKKPGRGVRALPRPGGVLVRLGEGGIDVDGAEDLVQADAVLHGGDELHDQVGGVLSGDGRAEDAVLARDG